MSGEHCLAYDHRGGAFEFFLFDPRVHTPPDLRKGHGNVGSRASGGKFARQLVETRAKGEVEVTAVTGPAREK